MKVPATVGGRRLRREHVVFLTSLRPALLPVLISLATAGAAYGQAKPTGGPTASPVGAMVYFVDVKDGVTIAEGIVHFGMRGMGLAPAGVDRPNSGHHHLLIDTDLPPLSEPIPSDFNHLHFGNGQTEAEINLRHPASIRFSCSWGISLRSAFSARDVRAYPHTRGGRCGGAVGSGAGRHPRRHLPAVATPRRRTRRSTWCIPTTATTFLPNPSSVSV